MVLASHRLKIGGFYAPLYKNPLSMPKSNLIALDAHHIIEVVSVNIARPLAADPLYIHDVDGGVQLLNGDLSDSNNTRDSSYYADVGGTKDNYSLALTPFSYTDIEGDKHESSKFLYDYGLGAVDPTMLLEYKTMRLYVSYGFSWGPGTVGEALGVFVDYGGRKIRLMNFYDSTGATRYPPAKASLSFNNKVYVSYIEFRVLDFEASIDNVAPESKAMRSRIFGLPPGGAVDRSVVSSYKFQYVNVLKQDYESTSIAGTNTDGHAYVFDRFRAYDWNNNFMLRAGYSKGLYNKVVVDGKRLLLGIAHDDASVTKVLSTLGSLDTIMVRHSLSVQEFDPDAKKTGEGKLVLENPSLQYGDIPYVPIIAEGTETLVVQLRTIITFTDTDVEINKYTTLVLAQAETSLLKNIVDMRGVALVNNNIINNIVKPTVAIGTPGGVGKKNAITFRQKVEFVHLVDVGVDGNMQPVGSLNILLGKNPRAVEFSFFNKGEAVDISPHKHLYVAIGGTKAKEATRPTPNSVVFYLSNPSGEEGAFEMFNDLGIMLVGGAIADNEAVYGIIAKKTIDDARYEAAMSAKKADKAELDAVKAAKALSDAKGGAGDA